MKSLLLILLVIVCQPLYGQLNKLSDHDQNRLDSLAFEIFDSLQGREWYKKNSIDLSVSIFFKSSNNLTEYYFDPIDRGDIDSDIFNRWCEEFINQCLKGDILDDRINQMKLSCSGGHAEPAFTIHVRKYEFLD